VNVQTLSSAEVRKTLNLLAADLGRAAYKRRNPQASDDEALAWGVENRRHFLDQAIDVLTMMALAEAEEQDGQAHS
jgi:hypothetical protein